MRFLQRFPSFRFVWLRTLASLALAPAVLAGCGEDGPIPTDPTVELTPLAGADHGWRPLATDLAQEVTTTYMGDPDGTGTALIALNPGQGEVCWELSVSDITLPAIASHIHRAPPGMAGPPVVWLSPPDAKGVATHCASGVDRQLILDILRNPASYYVNVHTSDHGPGAIRGQLPR